MDVELSESNNNLFNDETVKGDNENEDLSSLLFSNSVQVLIKLI